MLRLTPLVLQVSEAKDCLYWEWWENYLEFKKKIVLKFSPQNSGGGRVWRGTDWEGKNWVSFSSCLVSRHVLQSDVLENSWALDSEMGSGPASFIP